MANNMFSHSQQGLVLVVSVIFLLILTIMGITAMNSTVLNEKMASNLRNTTTSFDAAESALTDAEGWLQDQTGVISTCNKAPCQIWQLGTLAAPYQQTNSWWLTNGTLFSTTLGGVAQQPRYVIEQYSFVPYDLSPNALSSGRGYYYYRITSWGVGGTTSSSTFLQSIYCTQFN